MKLQSMRWLKNIVASSAIILSTSMIALADDPAAMGTASATSALSLYGTKTGLNDNLSKPLTDSTTSFKTVDGQTAFTAKMGQAASNAFLNIFIQPGTTGDLQKLIISEDLDMNGTADYIYTVPRVVSGICTNGYYSCDVGTWNNCYQYKWVAGAEGKVTDELAAQNELGGCFCINSSCGSHLVWDNTSVVLKDIGGGIVSAIQNANFNFTISSLDVQPVTISYYGSHIAGVASSGDLSGLMIAAPITGNTLYSNSGAISSSTNSLIGASNGVDGSLYDSVMSSPAAKSGTAIKICKIKAVPVIHTELKSINIPTEKIPTMTDHFIGLKIVKVSPTHFQIMMGSFGPKWNIGWGCDGTPYANGYVLLRDIIIDEPNFDLVSAQIIFDAMKPSSCKPNYAPWTTYRQGDQCPENGYPDLADVCSGNSYLAFDAMQGGFDVMANPDFYCPASGVQFPELTWHAALQYSYDNITAEISDNCSILDQDNTCQPYNETVDGVLTKSHGVSTHLTPLQSTKSLQGTYGVKTLTRDWWEKDEEYLCSTPTSYNFSDVKTRFGTVIQSSNVGTGLNYTDKSNDGNGWASSNHTIDMPSLPSVAACENACQTTAPHEDHQVMMSGVSSTLRVVQSGAIDNIYKTCVNNVCPLDRAGETILKDCQCMSSFDQVATATQMLRLAGKDLTCKKPITQ